jgi:SH3 domain-containing YSC84-like protein 1
MRKFALAVAFCAPALILADTAQERLTDATNVFKDIVATPDKGIPENLLQQAHCIIIVPGMKQAALGIGGKFGRGYAVCRKGADSNLSWGAPAAIRVEGGSFGFQIGASSNDVVMLITNHKGMRRLLEDKFTLGGEATVAAGPVGRTASANTDAQLSAEILSWSRSKGLFAGIALTGATMRPDTDMNQELYGAKLTNKEILSGTQAPPAGASELISLLDKYPYGSSTSGQSDRSKK